VSYKRGLAVVFGCAIATAVAFAATYPRFFGSANTPQRSLAHAGASSPATLSSVVEFPPLVVDNNPLSWAHLSAAQHAALAPFAAEWDKFSDERKRKWIRFAARFAKMSPEAQKRLQEHMTEWSRMTPDQRRVARENYQVSKALPKDARQHAWQAYQQLSPEQKAKLAAIGRKRRPNVVSAPPSGQRSEIRGLNGLVNPAPGASGANVASAPNAASAARAAPASAAAASGAVPSSGAVNTTVPVPPTPMSPSDAPSIFRGA
jgi:hypothetical protein